MRSALLSGNRSRRSGRACGFATMRLLPLRCVRLLGAGPGRYAGRPPSGPTPGHFIWATANQQIDSTTVHIRRYARADYYLKLLIPSQCRFEFLF
jgi:hypothetical protein